MNLEQQIDHAISVGKQGQLDEAERLLRAVLAQQCDNPRALANLGIALQMQDRAEEALLALDRSLELRPASATTHVARADVLLRLARPAEAADACRAALRLTPDDAQAHGLFARALLTAGDFKRGWIEYEWRWRCQTFKEERRSFPMPRWTGGKIAGKTILLHHEQGFGDMIQFIRYAPVLAERGAVVLVHGPAELSDLVRRLPSVAAVNPDPATINACDYHVPMMSLPLACNTTTLRTIPARVPYLAPAARAVQLWRERLAAHDDGSSQHRRLRVGIAWAGRPQHAEDKQRSLTLSHFAAIADAAGDGVLFYSLQKWDPHAQAARPPAGMRLIDLGPRLHDFSDAAAVIANLDLVITVDTAVAHLAGAMNRPVWVLLPFAPDFRWLLDRDDSPWYPTMRLLRQRRRGDWREPIQQAGAALRDLPAAAAAAAATRGSEVQ